MPGESPEAIWPTGRLAEESVRKEIYNFTTFKSTIVIVPFSFRTNTLAQ